MKQLHEGRAKKALKNLPRWKLRAVAAMAAEPSTGDDAARAAAERGGDGTTAGGGDGSADSPVRPFGEVRSR